MGIARAEVLDVPECPSYGERMRLTHLMPSFAGIPELRTSKCQLCKRIVTMPHGEGVAHSCAPVTAVHRTTIL